MSLDIEHKLVEVEKLTLDTNNPRIQKFVEMYEGELNADQLALALGEGLDDADSSESGTTFVSLREAIKTSGGIIHPIHVNKTDNGQLVVIEGNTRTVIYRWLKSRGVQGNWNEIPAIVYSGLEQEEIDSIRLQSHQVGPRAWDPYHKGKYLYKLSTQQDMPFSRLVDLCGGRKTDVRNYINAYMDMEKYYTKVLGPEDFFNPKRFSAFIELQKSAVKDSLRKANFGLEDFARWVLDERIYPLNTVRSLPRILANQEAKKIFLSKGAKPAIHYLDQQQDRSNKIEGSLFELCRAVTEKIDKITWEEIRKLKSNQEGQDFNDLLNLRDELNDLISSLND